MLHSALVCNVCQFGVFVLMYMSIGIVAFLESTFDWFIKERVVWALIIIAISKIIPIEAEQFFDFNSDVD